MHILALVCTRRHRPRDDTRLFHVSRLASWKAFDTGERWQVSEDRAIRNTVHGVEIIVSVLYDKKNLTRCRYRDGNSSTSYSPASRPTNVTAAQPGAVVLYVLLSLHALPRLAQLTPFLDLQADCTCFCLHSPSPPLPDLEKARRLFIAAASSHPQTGLNSSAPLDPADTSRTALLAGPTPRHALSVAHLVSLSLLLPLLRKLRSLSLSTAYPDPCGQARTLEWYRSFRKYSLANPHRCASGTRSTL